MCCLTDLLLHCHNAQAGLWCDSPRLKSSHQQFASTWGLTVSHPAFLQVVPAFGGWCYKLWPPPPPLYSVGRLWWNCCLTCSFGGKKRGGRRGPGDARATFCINFLKLQIPPRLNVNSELCCSVLRGACVMVWSVSASWLCGAESSLRNQQFLFWDTMLCRLANSRWCCEGFWCCHLWVNQSAKSTKGGDLGMDDGRGELSYLAPLGSEKISAPYFKQCFFRGGLLPPRQSNTTPPSPKTEITNILFYVLNLWRWTYCSGLRGCDTCEKEIVIWPCWFFMADIIFTLLSLLLCL